MGRKALQIFLVILASVILGVGVYLLWPSPDDSEIAMVPVMSFSFLATPSPTPTPEPTPVPTPPFPQQPPARIVIPKIGVDAKVVTVFSKDNEMQVARDGSVISWHGDSPIPGFEGNSFFAAHNRWSGEHAVFWDLYQLEPGDIATIHYEGGAQFDFTVRVLTIESYFDFPMELLGFMGMPAQVTLFTCHGTFNKKIGTSEQRVVVILDPPAW